MIQRPVVEFCYLTDADSILDPNAPSLWCKLATAVLVIVGVLALWGLTLWALVVDQTDHALWAVLVAVLCVNGVADALWIVAYSARETVLKWMAMLGCAESLLLVVFIIQAPEAAGMLITMAAANAVAEFAFAAWVVTIFS